VSEGGLKNKSINATLPTMREKGVSWWCELSMKMEFIFGFDEP
jgi:hypothetical protein